MFSQDRAYLQTKNIIERGICTLGQRECNSNTEKNVLVIKLNYWFMVSLALMLGIRNLPISKGNKKQTERQKKDTN